MRYKKAPRIKLGENVLTYSNQHCIHPPPTPTSISNSPPTNRSNLTSALPVAHDSIYKPDFCLATENTLHIKANKTPFSQKHPGNYGIAPHKKNEIKRLKRFNQPLNPHHVQLEERIYKLIGYIALGLGAALCFGGFACIWFGVPGGIFAFLIAGFFVLVGACILLFVIAPMYGE